MYKTRRFIGMYIKLSKEKKIFYLINKYRAVLEQQAQLVWAIQVLFFEVDRLVRFVDLVRQVQ